MPEIPVLETERLWLRGHRPDDFAACAAMWAKPETTRYIGGRPFTREEVWTRLLRYAGHWQWMGFGYWAMEDKATGRFVGELGFADYRRDMEPSIDGVPEAGWVLSPEIHGQGYGTEAVRAILQWGGTHFDAAETVCIIDPENAASLRIAAKVGYRERTRTTYHGHEVLLMAR